MTVEFTLDGVQFAAPNGGPQFKCAEAISFNVNCETQDEIDYFWEKLSAAGGSTGPCGSLEITTAAKSHTLPGFGRALFS